MEWASLLQLMVLYQEHVNDCAFGFYRKNKLFI